MSGKTNFTLSQSKGEQERKKELALYKCSLYVLRMDDLESRAITLSGAAQRMLGGVLARDDLHLMPDRISRAAYARALRGLRAIEAFARRVLLVLALAYEHIITVDMSERRVRASGSSPVTLRAPTFRIFDVTRAFPGGAFPERSETTHDALPDPRILFARTQRLQDLLKTPAARARRLAYTLARRRHGLLLAPDPGESLRRFGTEGSSLFDGLGARIAEDSSARPPPKGPRPRPPPRIRQL